MVCTHICIKGLDGVILQEGYVILYEFKKLKENEKNYATHDLDLATIVHSLKMWRNYFLGRILDIRVDHKSLNYLFDHPSLNSKQAIWLELLCEFDFEIKHVKDK